MGMGLRPVWVLLAAAALAILTITGCGGDGEATPNEAATDLPEQDGLEVGTEAPDFRMKNQDQETVVLSDYRGVSNVVLVFYPADFTPV